MELFLAFLSPRPGPRPRGRMPLLLFFLLATLGLSLWLGFQAVAAAGSHRRTAEGILRDYAEIAVSEYSRRIQDGLGRLIWDLFEEVPGRIRSGRPPGPEVVAREMGSALRRMGCRCVDLRARAAYLMVDLRTGGVETLPDTLSPEVANRAAEAARARWGADPGNRIAYFTAPPGEVLEGAAFLAFNASLEAGGEEGRGRAIYLLLVPLETLGEFFSLLYLSGPLLPDAVAGAQPNDSLLHLAVYTPQGHPVFFSPRPATEALAIRDTLPPEQGGLVVAAAVRPDAAPSLVIGGLPRARLPILLALMVLTLGVGIAALVQIRKEEELARLRDDFISGVSHEFRTPLTQIRMFTELMADGKLRTEEEWTRSTAVINREARRLTHLVENLLHVSRMGRAPLHQGPREEVVVREAIHDLTEAFAPLARTRRAEIEATVDPPGAVALASRSGLYQMLANLLDNALKYGPEGQTIHVEGEARNGRVRIAVNDQGPGIPPRERGRVWEPYRRLQRDVDGRETGSGIGLSVVKSLAEAGGGSAWVEEGRGGGARFVLDLPAAGPGDGGASEAARRAGGSDGPSPSGERL